MEAMVTFAHQNSAALIKPTPRARAQDRSCIPTAQHLLNSPAHAHLRHSTYESCARLGSCSRDPIGYRGGRNTYRFVSNNPGNRLDAHGMLDGTIPVIVGGKLVACEATGAVGAAGGLTLTAGTGLACGATFVGGVGLGYCISYYPSKLACEAVCEIHLWLINSSGPKPQPVPIQLPEPEPETEPIPLPDGYEPLRKPEKCCLLADIKNCVGCPPGWKKCIYKTANWPIPLYSFVPNSWPCPDCDSKGFIPRNDPNKGGDPPFYPGPGAGDPSGYGPSPFPEAPRCNK